MFFFMLYFVCSSEIKHGGEIKMDKNKENIDDIERVKEPEGMTKHLIYDVIFKAVFN